MRYITCTYTYKRDTGRYQYTLGRNQPRDRYKKQDATPHFTKHALWRKFHAESSSYGRDWYLLKTRHSLSVQTRTRYSILVWFYGRNSGRDKASGGRIGAMCRVSVFAFGVSGFGFRVSGLGFRISNFGFRISSFWFQVSGL